MASTSSQMEMLGQSVLRAADGTDLLASDLWDNQPAVVLVLRRPGCVLCRAEAQKLWSLKDQIKALGVNLVTVVHEWRDREVNAFAPEYWGGPVYHDLSKAFYKAVNGGTLLHGSVLGLLNPFSAVWRRINEARKQVASHNVTGEGLIMGGLMVVGAGGTGPFFVHVESDLGVTANPEEILEAVKAAAAEAAFKTHQQGPGVAQPAMQQGMPLAVQ